MATPDRFPFKPSITLYLDGPGGNIFQIIGACRAMARKIGFPAYAIEAFSAEVMEAESYDDALGVVRDWFDAKER